MSDNGVVNNMIAFIEEKEKQLQAEKMLGESSAKNDIVKAILDELEREVSNENK
jgi:hypothetical protein